MQKTLAKIVKTIQEHPLETITVASVITTVAVIGYYTRSNTLVVSNADLARFDRRPFSYMIFDIDGTDFALHKIHPNH